MRIPSQRSPESLFVTRDRTYSKALATDSCSREFARIAGAPVTRADEDRLGSLIADFHTGSSLLRN